MLESVLKHLPILHYKVDASKKIYDAWVGENVPSRLGAEKLTLKPLKELFPEVYRSIESWNGETEKVCEDKTDNQTLRSYIFNDSIHTGVYWVFAIVGQ
jgi:hypothetical protein